MKNKKKLAALMMVMVVVVSMLCGCGVEQKGTAGIVSENEKSNISLIKIDPPKPSELSGTVIQPEGQTSSKQNDSAQPKRYLIVDDQVDQNSEAAPNISAENGTGSFMYVKSPEVSGSQYVKSPEVSDLPYFKSPEVSEFQFVPSPEQDLSTTGTGLQVRHTNVTPDKIYEGAFAVVTMYTNYNTFYIDTEGDGGQRASIENGKLVSGNLDVTCYGSTGESSEEEEYMFVFPYYLHGTPGTEFYVAQSTGYDVRTEIHITSQEGNMEAVHESASAGTLYVGVGKHGAIGMHVNGVSNKQQLYIHMDDRSTPWDTVEFTCNSQDLYMTMFEFQTDISTRSVTTIPEITLSNSNTRFALRDVPVTWYITMKGVKSGAGSDIIVYNPDEQIILQEEFESREAP